MVMWGMLNMAEFYLYFTLFRLHYVAAEQNKICLTSLEEKMSRELAAEPFIAHNLCMIKTVSIYGLKRME